MLTSVLAPMKQPRPGGPGCLQRHPPENAEVFVRAVGVTAFLDQGVDGLRVHGLAPGLVVVAHCTENGLSVMPAS
jgi:hypothetical protein